MKSARVRFWRMMTLLFAFGCLSAISVPAQEGNPPGTAARLSFEQGNVSLQPNGATDWSQATLNYTLTTGDRLYTDQGGRAELEVGPYSVRMADSTDLTLANLDDQTMQLGIGQGSVQVTVYELPSGDSVEIDTPNGALTALGPGSYRVDVDPNNGTRVIANSGSLQLSGGDLNGTVQAGQAVELAGTGPIQVTSVNLPGQDDFDQWCASRDRRVESDASRQYVNPYDVPGAADLDAYGAWQQAPEYGPVWYPNDVPAGWVPYRLGHWAWIEPWGWTWVDDQPWGYGPFHYGRWVEVGSRWGWLPGPVAVRPVYSPALVAFVGGGGFSIGINFGGGAVAAWFPLGPRDPYIPWYHYSGDYLRRVNYTNVRNVTNITNITNVTNVTNINVRNIQYQYRTTAATAVPATVLQRGQPVSHNFLRVAPAQMARAEVIAHPEVTPARTAFYGGRSPVKAPTMRARVTAPPAATARPARPAPEAATRAVPEGRPAPATRGVVTPAPRPSEPVQASRPAPETRPAPTPATSPAVQRFKPRTFAAPPPVTPPHVVTKSAPPPRNVPFAQREPALQQHPGRPLEPQQLQNLRQGRPAGPQRDKEILPHGPAPRSQGKAESKPESRSKNDSKQPHRQ
jgi:Family of unknown function (DUF6600)